MSERIESPRLVLLGAAVMALALAAATANADTIYVCWDGSGDYLTIQEGIDAAQDGDEVVVCDGTYTGYGNRDLDFGGRLITVRSENGPENCIIDCEGSGRGFYFHSAETADAVVDGFTITNGYASDGGAVFCDGSSPTVSNCTFSGNYGDWGGGMCNNDSGSPTLNGCTFTNNVGQEAGAVFNLNSSSPTFIDCMFSGNQTLDGGSGAGMFNINSSSTLTQCIFIDNWAGYGGGLYNNNHSSATLTNCRFSRNYGGWGGAILSTYYSNLILTNCVFSGNSAGYGGGIKNIGSNAALTNCTFSGNSAWWGGGMLIIGSENVLLANCVFWHDTADQYGPELMLQVMGPYYSVVEVSYSDVEGGEAGVYVEDGCLLYWGDGNIDADPLFVNPDNDDYHLSPGSPCIDAANNTAVPDGTTTDLDGNPRFVDDPCTDDTGYGEPPIVDMGAYEYQPCAGDLDCDGDTDQTDLGILLADWGCDDPVNGCAGDLNGDDKSDQADLGILLADWGCDINP